jgi:quinolinate synthase
MTIVSGTPTTGPRPFTDYVALDAETIRERTWAVKRRLGKRCVILGHHYQREAIIEFADFRGDSFKLSQLAASQADADTIVFCGVHFMAESADVLAQPHQRVILPDLGAGCSMADMADADDVEEAWEAILETYGDEALPITYMNSTAAIKAFCGRHGGLVCTSSNAQAAFRWAWERKRVVLFLPDEHLGRNTGAALGVPLERMSLWNPRFAPQRSRALLEPDSPLVLWKGYCSVHQRFTVAQIDWVRQEFPGMRVVVHPECPYEVCQKADEVGSTDYIIRAVSGSPAGAQWAVGTEIHLVHRLAQQNPDKRVISLQSNVCACATMYRIDPPHLGWALENLAEGVVVNEIKVDEDTIRWARTALARMLEVGTDAQRIGRD